MGATDTRRLIVEAADRLFYERGFEATAFADIATTVGLSRGNFYYHFKTKDALLHAVIDLRMTNIQAMLYNWEREADTPQACIRQFFQMLVRNRAKISAYGCPVGSLCNELAKLAHGAQQDAARLLALFRDWLARQFAAWGRAADAEALALHVLMRSQGIAVLAAAFHSEDFIRHEVENLEKWLETQCPVACLPQ